MTGPHRMNTTALPLPHGPAEVVAKLTAHYRELAEQKHAKYPQYAGHWDDWELVQVTAGLRTSFGQAFLAGDLTIARREPERRRDGRFVTCYSWRNGIDTSVPADQVLRVKIVEATA